MATTLEKQTEILADLWLNYRDDENFADFFSYNDIGLPLAYVIANNIVPLTEAATVYITETFKLLLEGLEVDGDAQDFESLDQLLGLDEDEGSEDTEGGGQAKFCSQCGSQFASDGTKFCSGCGAARG
jgi:hypothetical protein